MEERASDFGLFSSIPTEMVDHILHFLPIRNLGIAAQVCKEWQALVNEQFKQLSYALGSSKKEPTAGWIEGYKRFYEHNSWYNMRDGRPTQFSSKPTLDYSSSVSCWTFAAPKQLWKGFLDGTIAIFDLQAGTLLHHFPTLRAECEGGRITSLEQSKRGDIIAQSQSGEISCWSGRDPSLAWRGEQSSPHNITLLSIEAREWVALVTRERLLTFMGASTGRIEVEYGLPIKEVFSIKSFQGTYESYLLIKGLSENGETLGYALQIEAPKETPPHIKAFSTFQVTGPRASLFPVSSGGQDFVIAANIREEDTKLQPICITQIGAQYSAPKTTHLKALGSYIWSFTAIGVTGGAYIASQSNAKHCDLQFYSPKEDGLFDMRFEQHFAVRQAVRNLELVASKDLTDEVALFAQTSETILAWRSDFSRQNARHLLKRPDRTNSFCGLRALPSRLGLPMLAVFLQDSTVRLLDFGPQVSGKRKIRELDVKSLKLEPKKKKRCE